MCEKDYIGSFAEYRQWVATVFDGPDIKWRLTDNGDAYVVSRDMRYEGACRLADLPSVIDDLTREYYDLVLAGEIEPKPKSD